MDEEDAHEVTAAAAAPKPRAAIAAPKAKAKAAPKKKGVVDSKAKSKKTASRGGSRGRGGIAEL